MRNINKEKKKYWDALIWTLEGGQEEEFGRRSGKHQHECRDLANGQSYPRIYAGSSIHTSVKRTLSTNKVIRFFFMGNFIVDLSAEV